MEKPNDQQHDESLRARLIKLKQEIFPLIVLYLAARLTIEKVDKDGDVEFEEDIDPVQIDTVIFNRIMQQLDAQQEEHE